MPTLNKCKNLRVLNVENNNDLKGKIQIIDSFVPDKDVKLDTGRKN